MQMGPRGGDRTGGAPDSEVSPAVATSEPASIQYPGSEEDIEVKDIPF